MYESYLVNNIIRFINIYNFSQYFKALLFHITFSWPQYNHFLIHTKILPKIIIFLNTINQAKNQSFRLIDHVGTFLKINILF